MANETASFTLEFRDKVSGPAGKASDSLRGVRASLAGVESAAQGAESSAGQLAAAHETAAQRMVREQRRTQGSLLAGREAAHRSATESFLRREKTSAHTVAGFHESSLKGMDDAMAHQDFIHRKRQEASAKRVAAFGQKMDDALEHQRWVATKRREQMERKVAMKRARSATGGMDFSLAAAGSGAGLAVGAIAAVTVAAGAAAVAVGYIGVKFLEAGVAGLEFGQRAELALGNLLHHGEDARTEFDEVRRMAQQLGLGVEDTVGSFQKLLAAQFEVGKAKELIRMGADLQGIGASAEEVGRALLAITQIKSKGKLMAQEMLQLQEAGISSELVYAALGKRLGKTRDELAKLQEAGKIDAGTGLEAILEAVRVKTGTSQAGELGEKFAGTTLAGMSGSLGAGVTNMFIDIGRQLEPIVMPIAQRLFGLFGALQNDPVLKGIGASLLESLRGFGEWVKSNWTTIQGTIVSGVQLLGRTFQFAADVGRFVVDNWGTIKTIGMGLGAVFGVLAVGAAMLLAPLYLVVAAVGLVVGGLIAGIGWIAENAGSWATAGYDMLMGFVQGIKNAAVAVKDAVVGAVSGAVDAATSFLGINSTSKLFSSFGAMTVEGYVAGVDQNADRASSATQQLVATGAEPVGATARSFGMDLIAQPTAPANDNRGMQLASVAPAQVPEPASGAVYEGDSSRVMNINIPISVAAGPGANAQDAERLGQALEPVVRRIVIKVLDEAS